MAQRVDGGDLMRELLETMLQSLVDAQATAHTASGDVTVKIPKAWTGSFFPLLLEPRRRIDVALHAVICQAYVEG